MEIKELFNSVLTGENSLFSTVISEIHVRKNIDNQLEISIGITGFRNKSSFKKISLLLKGIKVFYFYFDDDNYFYNIENYKFLSLDEGLYYLCFDPDDSKEGWSDDDLNYFIFKSISLIVEE